MVRDVATFFLHLAARAVILFLVRRIADELDDFAGGVVDGVVAPLVSVAAALARCRCNKLLHPGNRLGCMSIARRGASSRG